MVCAHRRFVFWYRRRTGVGKSMYIGAGGRGFEASVRS